MSCGSQLLDIESISSSSSGTTVSIEPAERVENYNKKYNKPDDAIMNKFVPEFINEVLGLTVANKENIDKVCATLKRKYRIMPSKPDIRTYYEKHLQHRTMPPIFHKWMVKKATRADSGVHVVTITLSPHKFSCKYDCFYCPQETDKKGVPTQPRSYLSTEPAMLRAIGTRTSTDSYDFDVMGQFQNRIQAYKFNGSINQGDKKAKKLEVILSGGTWHSYPKEYRDQVATEVFWAANTMSNPRPIKSLAEEIEENETAEYRIIGMTAETRPDQITPETIIEALNHGFTRFQLGEQTDNDVILKKVNRKCYKADSIRAHRLLKQAGFKLVVHLMPDLPGSSPEEDKRMFNSYLTDPGLQFDDVKIYPTAICKSPDADRIVYSKIAEWHKQGLYTPYAEKNVDSLVDVIMDYKRKVSPHVRIQRVVRDIPGQSIEAGYNKKSNLRQMIHDKMKKLGYVCNCIYCKEIGDQELDDHDPILVVRKYAASEGTEYHLSMEAHKMTSKQRLNYNIDRAWNAFQWFFTGRWNYWAGDLDSYTGLYGFCRLRIDPNPGGDWLPVLNGCGLIREVHVYGFSLGVGNDAIGSQHRGYGKMLVSKAEELTALNGLKNTAVIAGVGTKEYYKNKCGYHKEEAYMKKSIQPYNYFMFERATFVVSLAALIAFIARSLY